MLETFIKALKSGISLIKADWLILGALIIDAFIFLAGFIMTLCSARAIRKGSPFLIIKSRSRRNLIFTVAFAFVIVSTLAIFTLFPGAELFYLTIPALVLLWTFIIEALFEGIENKKRKRIGVTVCYCDCTTKSTCNCTQTTTSSQTKTADVITEDVATFADEEEEIDKVKDNNAEEKQPESKKTKNRAEAAKQKAEAKTAKAMAKKEAKVEAKTAKATAKQEARATAKKENNPDSKKENKADSKQENKVDSKQQVSNKDIKQKPNQDEIQEVLKRAQELNREREEMEQWREELKEEQTIASAEEEEIRRRRFENERKQLAILARQAQAAQFGENSTQTEAPKKPADKPATTPAAPKPALFDSPTQKPAQAITASQSSVTITSPKAATEVKTGTVIDENNQGASETVTRTTISRTYQSSVISSDNKSSSTFTASEDTEKRTNSSTQTKFDSLQAKLDLLRKDNAARAATTNKTETKGKYDEGEVKSALSDLIKSMNARRENRSDE